MAGLAWSKEEGLGLSQTSGEDKLRPPLPFTIMYALYHACLSHPTSSLTLVHPFINCIYLLRLLDFLTVHLWFVIGCYKTRDTGIENNILPIIVVVGQDGMN